MKNTFGNQLSVTLFGESHGPAIGAVLDGLPAGFELSMEKIQADLDLRRAKGKISTARQEADQPVILSGLFNGKTAGTPLALIIENKSTRSKDYSALQYRLRPGHADFTAFEKYHGFQDYRGGGHFSGRLTAALTAAGSICLQILAAMDIHIASHIRQLNVIEDIDFSENEDILKKQMEQVSGLDFPVLSQSAAAKMRTVIETAAAKKDSVGGILETAITGLPAGLGEPFFDSAESVLAHMLFSIPAVKGVSFGAGFGFAKLHGSQANDAFIMDETIKTRTNHNAGINGGITNGMPVKIHTVFKPTPSIYKEQDSVDYLTKEEVKLEIKGRHDPCIIHRAAVVVNAALAIALLDLLCSYLSSEELMERASSYEH